MSEYEANPFSDPFADQSVTSATANSQQADSDDYNPFANQNQGSSQPAVMEPTGAPPAYSPRPAATVDPQPTLQQQALPGQEELLRRQEELERKAEELARREQQLNAGNINARRNNWPPLPKWCPIGPCFIQDFALDIPVPFQRTVKMVYYAWMFYIIILFLNIFTCLFVYTQNKDGILLIMPLVWFCIYTPCSICWYRPAYSAFKSDSSFFFFVFFFIMFAQIIVSITQAIGISYYSGFCGWMVAAGSPLAPWVAIFAFLQSTLFTLNAILQVVLLMRVHSFYRKTDASFEKAQQEFASGALKNPGVQKAAAQAASAAVASSLSGNK